MYKLINNRMALLVVLVVIISACGKNSVRDSAPKNVKIDINKIANATPKKEPFSRYGNPKQYSIRGKTYYTLNSNKAFKEKGDASWYGTMFHGRRTSSGETYDMYAMTAAHKTLPLPTYVKVTNLDNGKHIVVKVNDRGPFHAGRIIDLSYVAALKLDIVKSGTGRVEIESIESVAKTRAPKKPKAKLFVQVGAYFDKQNAEKVHDKLAAASIESDVYKVVLNAKKQIYRVRIGPFKKRNDAGQMIKNLKKLGVSNAKVFSDNGE